MSDREDDSSSSTESNEITDDNNDTPQEKEKAEDMRQAVFRTMRRRPPLPVKKDNSKIESLPWIEKYRPKSMSEVISHDNKIKVLSSLMPKREIPHLLLYGEPGTGKCAAKGTKVRLYNGQIEVVENLKPGDQLRGDDDIPRTILSVCSGTDQMYKVEQSSGITYEVNEPHILSLIKTKANGISWQKDREAWSVEWYENHIRKTKRFYVKSDKYKNRKSGQANISETREIALKVAQEFLDEMRQKKDYTDQGAVIDIPVLDYMKKSELWKKNYKGFRVPINYKSKQVELEPYMLGLWLGDGTSTQPEITNIDPEVIDYIYEYGRKNKLRISNSSKKPLYRINSGAIVPGWSRNAFMNQLKKYNLLNNKHIPDDFKYNDRKVRLEVLAGLIDSDGYVSRNKYEITHKNHRLAQDIQELCWSLGYKCTLSESMKKCTNSPDPNHSALYYRMYISADDFSEVPVKIPRKKITFKQDKINFMTSNLKVTPTEVGEYYGFELDGNGRFLLEDNTVTHNTSLILAMARTMYGENWKRYVLELNASDDRGIDIVRNRIPLFAKSRADDMRLIILDEADAMTADAQSALRRIMELYIRTCRFCLICNNINKIIPGVQSRCAKMRFGVLDRGSIRQKLYSIVKEEGIGIEEEAMDKLLENFKDFRQILNMLQCLRSIRLGDVITANDVKEYLGKADKETLLSLIEMLEKESFKKCYQTLLNLHWDNKINLTDLIESMVKYLVDHEDMTEERRSILLDGLASVEYRIITGSDTEVQLASLVGVWLQAREIDN